MSLSPRGPVPDCEYLLDRANAEIEAADRSPQDCARALHRKLAGLYMDRVFGDRVDEAPAPRPSPLERRRILTSPFKLLRPVVDPDPAPAFQHILETLDSVSSSGR